MLRKPTFQCQQLDTENCLAITESNIINNLAILRCVSWLCHGLKHNPIPLFSPPYTLVELNFPILNINKYMQNLAITAENLHTKARSPINLQAITIENLHKKARSQINLQAITTENLHKKARSNINLQENLGLPWKTFSSNLTWPVLHSFINQSNS